MKKIVIASSIAFLALATLGFMSFKQKQADLELTKMYSEEVQHEVQDQLVDDELDKRTYEKFSREAPEPRRRRIKK